MNSRFFVVVLSFLALVLIAANCDNPADPDPPKKKETFSKRVTATEDGEKLSGVTFTTGSRTEENTDAITLSGKEGTSASVTAQKDGYDENTITVRFTDNDSETIALTREEATTVMITVDPQLDGATYADAEIFNAQTDEKLGDGKAEIERKQGSELPVRIEGPDIETQSETLTFDETKVLDIALERKAATSVTLTVTPEIQEYPAEQRTRGDDFTQFSVTINGTEYVNEDPSGTLLQAGESFDVEISAGSSVEITGRFVYVRADREPFFGQTERSLAVGEMSVSASEDRDVSLTLNHQPACSDGISNDGSSVMDENASGCVADDSPTAVVEDPARVYDPDDEVETLLSYRKFFNFQRKRLTFVSSKEDESNLRGRRVGLLGNEFPEAIKFAIGPVPFFLDTKIEDDQDGEESAVEIKCRPLGSDTHADDLTPYISEIIPDDPEVDGWRTSRVTGFSGELFAQEGIDCSLALIHGSLARSEEPGDGEDDVVMSTEEQPKTFGYDALVEPETLPAELRPDANTQMVGTREKLEN